MNVTPARTLAAFEKKLPTEDADIAAVVRDILIIQARFAAEQKRPLGRGTHTKGVCARATFEIFDVARVTRDAALAARLGQGLFARPGVYPATVRFANAASTFQSDAKRDVRALSFSIEIPAGIVGPGATRVDLSMNNAPTFPINDVHAFASFMKLQGASGLWGKFKALFSLPIHDIAGVLRTAARGLKQQRGPLRPYQQTRYWSNVPFSFGEADAIKYSAIPAPDNPGLPVRKTQDGLRDELARHLSEDRRAASFDIGLQLLDAARMTSGGKTCGPEYWVENASVEWPESESPFHVVGRLTLVANSLIPDAECQSMYIDVTDHPIPGTVPIGSINRGRWAVESASRHARMSANAGAPVLAPAPQPGLVRRLVSARDRVGNITLRTIFRTVLLAIGLVMIATGILGLATIYYTTTDRAMLPREHVDDVIYADQGWGAGVEAAARQVFYYTPQGAGLKDVRYSWFVHLEMPLGRQRFADPEVLRRYGFLVDSATDGNPDQLPVGFSKHFDRQLNEELLDITCAACHTGQVNVTRDGRTTALRIDGGSALHAFTDSSFGHFVPTMLSSMMSTLVNPFKFNRFARKVLGPAYPKGKMQLRLQLLDVLKQLGAMGLTEKWHGLVPTEEGYGRTDALTRIANTVFADHLDSANYEVGDAPVNYPPVWNIWKFDWVQYNASVSQPMARNIGESMGTGAKYALLNRYGGPLPPEQRFRSSALLENLHKIELTLRTLQPPVWPEDIFGAVDRARAERGRELFDQNCVKCHGPFNASPELKLRNSPLKTAADPEWIVRTVCVGDIGTDPNTAENFVRASVDLTKSGLTAADLRRVARPPLEAQKARDTVYLAGEIARLKALPQQTPYAAKQIADLEARLAGLGASIEQALSKIDPKKVPVGAALSYVGTMIREKAYTDHGIPLDQQPIYDGFGSLDLPQIVNAYKPRPLAGMWATPPYLHNGSVPTIYDLLSPVEERPRTFRVGSREYDTEKLGLKQPASGYWLFDTSKDGNHNTGHEFSREYVKAEDNDPPKNGRIGPYLPPEDRLAIIEYLKVRNDDRDGPTDGRMPPATWSCPPPAPRAKR
jgi:mono/diheme cytochrome c family protein